MQRYFQRILKLILGLFLYAFGIVVTMKANIGFAPWQVFHEGLANISGFTIGQISIIIGFLVCIIDLIMGEKLGIGTLFNMLLIGIFIDLIIFLDFIPIMKSFSSGLIMLFVGMFIIAAASFFYISSSFGAGPRDSLMVAVEKKTGFTVGTSKALIEGAVVFTGWLLGGPIGLGTVIAAFGIGFCIEIVFRLVDFDPSEIEHESFLNTYAKIRNK